MEEGEAEREAEKQEDQEGGRSSLPCGNEDARSDGLERTHARAEACRATPECKGEEVRSLRAIVRY